MRTRLNLACLYRSLMRATSRRRKQEEASALINHEDNRHTKNIILLFN